MSKHKIGPYRVEVKDGFRATVYRGRTKVGHWVISVPQYILDLGVGTDEEVARVAADAAREQEERSRASIPERLRNALEHASNLQGAAWTFGVSPDKFLRLCNEYDVKCVFGELNRNGVSGEGCYVVQMILGDRVIEEWDEHTEHRAIATAEKEFSAAHSEADSARVITTDGEFVWSTDMDEEDMKPNGKGKRIELPNGAVMLFTDNKWKQFKYRDEVPKRVLKSEFDYLDEDDGFDGFFKYKNTWHHTSQFMHGDPFDGEGGKWDGYLGFSYTNGLVIKLSNDGETYKVGYYYNTSD